MLIDSLTTILGRYSYQAPIQPLVALKDALI
nr:MAG TPA_asm: hypothetical protein [Bacteriophage sp.]